MWPFSNKKLSHCNPQFEQYRQWANEQVCCDCGAKASERNRDADGKVIDDLWATETQCFKCFVKLGCQENRGLRSARNLADKDRINI